MCQAFLTHRQMNVKQSHFHFWISGSLKTQYCVKTLSIVRNNVNASFENRIYKIWQSRYRAFNYHVCKVISDSCSFTYLGNRLQMRDFRLSVLCQVEHVDLGQCFCKPAKSAKEEAHSTRGRTNVPGGTTLLDIIVSIA